MTKRLGDTTAPAVPEMPEVDTDGEFVTAADEFGDTGVVADEAVVAQIADAFGGFFSGTIGELAVGRAMLEAANLDLAAGHTVDADACNEVMSNTGGLASEGEFASLVGMPQGELIQHDLIRFADSASSVTPTILYPKLQVHANAILAGLEEVVGLFRKKGYNEATIIAFLGRPHPALGNATPLATLRVAHTLALATGHNLAESEGVHQVLSVAQSYMPAFE